MREKDRESERERETTKTTKNTHTCIYIYDVFNILTPRNVQYIDAPKLVSL